MSLVDECMFYPGSLQIAKEKTSVFGKISS